MFSKKEFQMIDESKVLEVVKSVTETNAYFFNGTLFLETQDSKIATAVFDAIWTDIGAALMYGKCGTETSYDFLG
jgi:hypothetical protein